MHNGQFLLTFKYRHYIVSSMDLNEMTFVIFDFETTGMSPIYGDRICEIGAVKVKGKETLGQIDTLINPQRSISPGATAINGITDEMVADAPLIQEVLPEFLKFIEDAVLVAHNVRFDLSFLAAAVYEQQWDPLPNFLIDTLTLSRKLYAGYSRHSLDELRYRFQIFYPGVHRGLGDSLTTRDVLWIFLEEIQNRHGGEFEYVLKYHGPPYVFPAQVNLGLTPYPTELREALEVAIQERRSLFIEYIPEGQRRPNSRVIDPYFLVQKGQYSYLRAYCHLRRDVRTFRLDRITRLHLTEYTFAEEPR